VPAPAPADATAGEQKEGENSHFIISVPSSPAPLLPEPIPGVSSLPIAPVVTGSTTQVTLEAYTPRPRKGSQGSSGSNLVKSQSFPSGFQPHISLGSMLPGASPETLLQSNLAAPAMIPTRSDSMPAINTLGSAPAAAVNETNEHKLSPSTSDASAAGALALPTEAHLLKSLQSSQIFLGMIAMRDQPKIEVRALVEDMKNAGIRFVFFSPDNERKTQVSTNTRNATDYRSSAHALLRFM
jgi:hypothetical protein